MRNISLDTNCLLALLLSDRQNECEKVEDQIKQHEAYISDAVLFELEYVLNRLYKMPRKHVSANMRAIANKEKLKCNERLLSAVLPLYEDSHSLSFTDFCLIFYAEEANALPLYTFDKKMANQSNGKAKLL